MTDVLISHARAGGPLGSARLLVADPDLSGAGYALEPGAPHSHEHHRARSLNLHFSGGFERCVREVRERGEAPTQELLRPHDLREA